MLLDSFCKTYLIKEYEKQEDISIIGQFGVGFYSAFMVAKEIRVKSLAYGSDQAYEWVSNGADGYSISECDKDTVGTEITLVIKDNTDIDNYMYRYTLRLYIGW